MVARPTLEMPTGLWDDPVNRVNPGDAELQFVDFFDWRLLDYRDYQNYRVSIDAFAAQPHLVGREALVERQYVKVFIADAAV
jgi:hypothetical protein